MIELQLGVLLTAGLACVALTGRAAGAARWLALLAGGYLLVQSALNFFVAPPVSVTRYFFVGQFAGFFALLCAFFMALVIVYSISYARNMERQGAYFGYIMWSAAFAIGAVHARHLIVLAVMWGLSGVVLYLLACLQPGSANAAKKSFIYAGGADAVMMLGILIVGFTAQTFILGGARIDLHHAPWPLQLAFICFCVAALTKAGAMPFHSWIPDFAATMPLSVTALLPASLDKILGVYLLVVTTTQLFILTPVMVYLLLIVGAVTIIAAVSMAMVQHDMRRLLSYHAVSQVGYMVVGIATGTPLGIAGGVFHMLNNAVYKTLLVLNAGSVEHRTGTTHLDRLGGLAAFMPVSAAVCVVGALAIAGIPPFNGFASKWMIYQSLMDGATAEPSAGIKTSIYVVTVIAAVFGSSFTLASFIKMLHAVYFGQRTRPYEKGSIVEAGASMIIPMLTLAVLCVLFGILPGLVPLGTLIGPAFNAIPIPLPQLAAFLQADAALILIFAGALGGLALAVFYTVPSRRSTPFIGGETLPLEARAPAVDFYRTITEIPLLRRIFALAEHKWFDLYDVCTKAILSCGRVLSAVQTGSVHTYILLCLLGLVIACAALL